MGEISRIGVDTSKAVFTLRGVEASGRALLRLNLRRSQFLAFFAKLPLRRSVKPPAAPICGSWR
jgi:transposase